MLSPEGKSKNKFDFVRSNVKLTKGKSVDDKAIGYWRSRSGARSAFVLEKIDSLKTNVLP